MVRQRIGKTRSADPNSMKNKQQCGAIAAGTEAGAEPAVPNPENPSEAVETHVEHMPEDPVAVDSVGRFLPV
jgi:hypothetical protein